jgi:putative ABC transport system permease protein
MLQDVKHSARTILQDRRSLAPVVLTLALACGPFILIQTVVYGVLARPLPFGDADRVVLIQETTKVSQSFAVTPADYVEWVRRTRSIEGLAAFSFANFNLTLEQTAERVMGARVAPGLFSTLKARAALGRCFTASDPGESLERSVVLSDRLWRRWFGADPGIVGHPIVVNGAAHTVLGVMPPGFSFPSSSEEMWAPLMLQPKDAAERTVHSLWVVGRLRPGISREAARAEMDAIARQLAEERPESNRGYGATVVGIRERLIGDIRQHLLMLFAAVVLLLGVGIANAANMLLARAMARRAEIGIRVALGASRWRVFSHFAAEGFAVTAPGFAAGLALAYGGLRALVALSPPALPRLEDIVLNARAITVSGAVCLLVAAALAAVLAASALQLNLSETLRENDRTATAGRRRERLRNGFVCLVVALSVVLVTGAGLLGRSLLRLLQVDPGFRSADVVTASLDLGPGYAGRQVAFYEALLERVTTLPGVAAAGFIDALPLAGLNPMDTFVIEGRPRPQPGEEPAALAPVASPGYFAALGVPLLRGRYFEERDNAKAPCVVLINRALAAQNWRNADPVGQRIRLPYPDFGWCSIVGVVGNIKHRGLAAGAEPTFYYNYLQIPPSLLGPMTNRMTLVVRAKADLRRLARAAAFEVHALDRNQPLYAVQTMEEALRSSTAAIRFNTLLLGLFSAIALLLAATAIYGVLSYAVSQRRHELAIRMALGASPGQVVRAVAGRSLAYVLTGALLGAAASAAAAPALKSVVFGIGPFDPWTMVGAGLVLLVVAACASYLPARTAARLGPAAMLKR